MRALIVTSLIVLAALVAACSDGENGAPSVADTRTQATAVATGDESVIDADVSIVVAPAVKGRVDEALILDAFRRAAAQGEQDFGIRPERPVTIFIDPDSAIGLEDALGLSSRYAIHLRAGRTNRMETLLPLMMHEYMHVLQYDIGRLRPQWWIEGQADHQGQRVVEPGRAARDRKALLSSLAADVKKGRAPSLASLRGSTGWDEYIKRSGAGRAYGWGQAAVAFIEDGWGFDAVKRIATDSTGANTYGSFDEAIRRETGLDAAQFEQGLHDWLLRQG
ncbi:MAG: hypothetical protein AB7R89_09310 [Dehalococcoidia bacterium]